MIESDLYEVFTPRPYGLERHPMNFNDEYLLAKVKDVLEKELNEYTEVLRYYTAAFRVNPFEVKNYACCTFISIFNNDVDAVIICVNEERWSWRIAMDATDSRYFTLFDIPGKLEM